LKHIPAPSYIALIIFLIFSVFFTFWCGLIGYAGDSWNYIYTSLYTEDFFDPPYFKTYWLRHRPGEYAFNVYLLQKWGELWLHPLATHFMGLLFLSFCVFWFGRVLENMYPDEPLFIIMTLLLTFFHGHLFSSSFIIRHITFFFTGITFWGMCVCFFKLVKTHSFVQGFFYTILSLILYLFSVLTYELFILVILALPVLVFFGKHRPPSMTTLDKLKQIILRTILPVAGIFGILLGIKYLVMQHIGRSTNFSLYHFLAWVWKYGVLALMYEVDAVKYVGSSQYRYLALIVLIVLFLVIRDQKPSLTKNHYSPFLPGGIIFLLGVTPLIIAEYEIDLYQTDYSSGRYFSSSFGVVLMLSGFLLIKRSTIFHSIAKFVLIFILSCNIAFSFILADAWKEATRLQKSLYSSLLELCPDVEDETHFIFLDAQPYGDFGVEILGSPSSSAILPQIIYNNRTLRGGLAYSGTVTHGRRIMIITPDGIRPRIYKGNFPVNKVIIVKNTGKRFEIVDLHRTDLLNAIWAESYFELSKDSLHSLGREGVSEEIVKDLKPLKHQAFFKKNFLEALKKHIGKENTEKYQSLILKHSWNWTEESFTLTDQDMQRLRKDGVPEGTLTWLERVKNRAFPREKDFLEAAEDYIGKEARKRYRELFVKHARKKANGITEVKSNTNLIKQKRVTNAFTEYVTSLPD